MEKRRHECDAAQTSRASPEPTGAVPKSSIKRQTGMGRMNIRHGVRDADRFRDSRRRLHTRRGPETLLQVVVSGPLEIIESGVRRLIAPAPAHAETICGLLADCVRRRGIAAAGRIRVEQSFSPQASQDRLVRFLDEVLGSHA